MADDVTKVLALLRKRDLIDKSTTLDVDFRQRLVAQLDAQILELQGQRPLPGMAPAVAVPLKKG